MGYSASQLVAGGACIEGVPSIHCARKCSRQIYVPTLLTQTYIFVSVSVALRTNTHALWILLVRNVESRSRLLDSLCRLARVLFQAIATGMRPFSMSSICAWVSPRRSMECILRRLTLSFRHGADHFMRLDSIVVTATGRK